MTAGNISILYSGTKKRGIGHLQHLFGNLFADNRKKYVQQFRNNGDKLYLQILSDIDSVSQLNSQITLTTHKPDGTLISTITDYESGLNIDNINFRTGYTGTTGVNIDGYQGILFYW